MKESARESRRLRAEWFTGERPYARFSGIASGKKGLPTKRRQVFMGVQKELNLKAITGGFVAVPPTKMEGPQRCDSNGTVNGVTMCMKETLNLFGKSYPPMKSRYLYDVEISCGDFRRIITGEDISRRWDYSDMRQMVGVEDEHIIPEYVSHYDIICII